MGRKNIQQGPNNTASGNDEVGVQVGQVRGRANPRQATPPPAPANTQKVRSGNATVGRQEDVIEGGLTIRF